MTHLITRVGRKSPALLPSIFYESAVASGKLNVDEGQQKLLPILDSIIKDLPSYDASINSHSSLRHVLETQREVAVKHDEDLPSNHQIFHGLRQLLYGLSSNVSSAFLPNRYNGLPEPPIAPIPPRGVYLYGDVGCGKSLMMEILFHCAKQFGQSSSRVHYLQFMSSIYAMIHRYDEMTDHQREQMRVHHPLDVVVGELGLANSADSGGSLLCFDEFQVTDVADTKLMNGIFHRLMNCGTIICFTSNRVPVDLNRSQLHDEDSIRFLDFIHEHCELVHMNSRIDYRHYIEEENIAKNRKEQMNSSCNEKSKDKNDNTNSISNLASSKISNYLDASDIDGLLQLWTNITDGVEWDDVCKVILRVAHGRKLHLGRALSDGRAVQLTFAELIEAPIGANDYLALCKFSKNIFLTDVLPVFTDGMCNLTQRFITLIDVCYEMKAKLFMCMEAPSLNNMFNLSIVATKLAQDLNLDGEARRTGVVADNQNRSINLNIYEGEDGKFLFSRAISRLKEMQSDSFGKPTLFDVEI